LITCTLIVCEGKFTPNSENDSEERIEMERRAAASNRFDNQARGSYLELFTHIDWVVSEIITTHFLGFGDARRVELIAIVMRNPALSVRNKIGMMRMLLKNDYPDLFSKYSKELGQLDELTKFRNRPSSFAACVN